MIWNIYFAVLALLLGFFFATVLALGKNSNLPLFSAPCRLFIFIFSTSALIYYNISKKKKKIIRKTNPFHNFARATLESASTSTHFMLQVKQIMLRHRGSKIQDPATCFVLHGPRA